MTLPRLAWEQASPSREINLCTNKGNIMSCFIHEDTTYDRLLATFTELNNIGLWYFKESPKEWLTVLRSYNVAAFDERYPDDELAGMPDEWIPHPGTILTDVEAFKLLKSIDYQCLDYKKYLDSEVRRQLCDLRLHFANSFICGSKEYQKASWG